MNETVAKKETLDVQLQDADDEFDDEIDDELDDENNWGYADSYDETKLKDWSVCNYSSEEKYARISIVECGGKTYDPLTFKRGMNNTYALAFHLSTEVAVSAAQARNGSIFNVAKVDGSDAYKALMAQMQQDLKGDRYKTPFQTVALNYSIKESDKELPLGSPFIYTILYKAYLSRLYRYLIRPSPPPPPTNPIPIFEEILTGILNVTEYALGAKLNATSGYFGQDKIYMHITSPFLLNHTYTSALSCAMTRLDLRIYNHDYSLLVSSYTKWSDHANDKQDYSGVKGTELAFEQARHNVAMNEFSERRRPGEYRCGTPAAAFWREEVKKMKMNGTWVEPPVRGVLDFECANWRQCWRIFVWEWVCDGAYDELEFEGTCQLSDLK